MSVLVVGGAGCLGRSVSSAFRAIGRRVVSVDLVECPEATTNVLVGDASKLTFADASLHAKTLIEQQIAESDRTFDAVVCTAGAWAGGGVGSVAGLQSIDFMMDANLKGAVVAAHLASTYLESGGLLVLTGAHAALQPTSGMVGYGMVKAATHHLVSSLADSAGEADGLPQGSVVVGMLPNVIDTPANRNAMPAADYSGWTPPSEFSDRITQWASGDLPAPKSGALLSFLTEAGATTVVEAAP